MAELNSIQSKLLGSSETDFFKTNYERKFGEIASKINLALTAQQKKLYSEDWCKLLADVQNELGESFIQNITLPTLKPNYSNDHSQLHTDTAKEIDIIPKGKEKVPFWKRLTIIYIFLGVLSLLSIGLSTFLIINKKFMLNARELDKKAFMDSSFTPRPITIRNLSNETFDLLTMTIINYDLIESKSLGKTISNWQLCPPIEKSFPTNTVLLEPLKTIVIPSFDKWNGKGVFASIHIRSKSPPYKEFSFSRVLAPGYDKVNQDGVLEIHPLKNY
jgi:hypothetical protein